VIEKAVSSFSGVGLRFPGCSLACEKHHKNLLIYDLWLGTVKKKKKKTPKPKPKNKIQKSKGNSLTAAVTKPHTIPKSQPSISFLVVGDWGGPGRDPQKNVAKAMHTIANQPNGTIDFIISTGDNMYEDGVENDQSKKFQRNFENVYVYPTQQCRWYMSFGNHDHGAHGVMRDAQGEVNYTRYSKRWYLPSTYYMQQLFVTDPSSLSKSTILTVDLFVLDTYDYSPYVTQMTEPQLKWFEKSLAKSTAHVKIVVGHRPMFSAGAKHGSSPYMRKVLEPLFRKYGVALYLCGDDHELQMMESEGVVHLLSGGGARAKHDLKKKGVPQTFFQSGVNGFMRVEVKKETLDVQVFNQFAERLFVLKDFAIGSKDRGEELRRNPVLLP
jgi:tartrate-resistant acid phosphatase type 5